MRVTQALAPALAASLLVGLPACQKSSTVASYLGPVAPHSSSMALGPTGLLYVANPDADSVSVVDTNARTLKQEILLGAAHPAADSNGNYFPPIRPRAVALSPQADRLYVSGEQSGTLYTISLSTNTVTGQLAVGAEPAGILVRTDGTVYVACSNDTKVVSVNAAGSEVLATAQTPPATTQTTAAKPWGLSWSTDESQIYVSMLLGVGVVVIDPDSMAVTATWAVPDVPIQSGADDRIANGTARGFYDVAARPGTNEVWTSHMLLSNTTTEIQATTPILDFENTVFPTLSILQNDGTYDAYLTTDAEDVPGINGAFGDVVSGPHAFQFTADGRYLLLVNAGSEDILVVDAYERVESSLLRPLSLNADGTSGHQPEGIVLSADGTKAYVQERNTNDVAVVDLAETSTGLTLTIDGTPISTIASDPMPAVMRQGQHMFNSANSDELELTTNHWVSCSVCHIEGRSDGVTWRFAAGPRDTPSNAGGTIGTGFLLHTADRRTVQDYWRVINVEMGGDFSPTVPAQATELDALEAFVDHALPVPAPPTTDATLVAQGEAIFQRAPTEANSPLCIQCHTGPLKTDSGAGNPTLDLSGPVLVHNVGTCNTSTAFPDIAHTDDNGNPRDPCSFDTPALRGMADSAPYFHDGSATTLRDALENTRGTMGNINVLSADEETALIAYLQSL